MSRVVTPAEWDEALGGVDCPCDDHLPDYCARAPGYSPCACGCHWTDGAPKQLRMLRGSRDAQEGGAT